MARDDRSTIESLESARAVFQEIVQAHKGRVVDTVGDSVLAAFDSASSAVEAALAVQSRLAQASVDVPQERRMQFRIGVHLGDIIEKPDGSVYGDGVNVAARLEGIAPAGGVAVSDAVRTSVRNRVTAVFEDLGERQVKNIDEPVRAFLVQPRLLDDRSSVLALPRQIVKTISRPQTSLWVVGALGLVLVALAVSVTVLRERSTDPGKPPLLSIAILPLKSVRTSDNAEEANALSLELTRWLAQTVVGHAVRPAAAVRAVGDDFHDLSAVGAELNVRYLVQGAVDRDRQNLIVTIELVDTQTRQQVWSARIPTPIDRAGDLVATSALRILSQLRPAIYEAQAKSLDKKPAGNASALELAFRGLYVQSSVDYKTQINASTEECDAALRIDSSLALALYCKAHVLNWVLFGAEPGTKGVLDLTRLAEMDELTARAVAMDRYDADIWNFRANVLRHQRKWNAVLEARNRALELNPALVESYIEFARDEVRLGRPDRALETLNRAIDVNPGGSGQDDFLIVQCRAYLGLGNFQKSVESCEKLASGGFGYIGWRVFLAASYAQLGQLEKAAAARDRAIADERGLTIASWRAIAVAPGDAAAYVDQVDRNIVEGMRKAGFPEK